MGSNMVQRWVANFAVSTIIVFIVLEAFEFAVFGGLLYFSSTLGGMVLPTAMVYSILLGVVFGTAQYVLSPSSSVQVHVSRAPKVSAAKKVSAVKKVAKRSKAKKKIKRKRKK